MTAAIMIEVDEVNAYKMDKQASVGKLVRPEHKG